MVTAGCAPRAAVAAVEARLAAAGCPDADFDARELFRLACGRDPRLADRPLTPEQAARLEALCARVLNHAALTICLHGSEEAAAQLRTLLPESLFAAAERAPARPYAEPLAAPCNEAFVIDGGVNYAVLAWPMARRSERAVLARVMSYEYLWHEIREVGGAYGTGMNPLEGAEALYTFRDPRLAESYATFAAAPAALAGRDYTEKDLTDAIIGAVSKLDTPRKPRAEALEVERHFFCGETDAMRAADRAALCAMDAGALKAQASALPEAMARGVRVAFGSRASIEAAKELFDRVEEL